MSGFFHPEANGQATLRHLKSAARCGYDYRAFRNGHVPGGDGESSVPSPSEKNYAAHCCPMDRRRFLLSLAAGLAAAATARGAADLGSSAGPGPASFPTPASRITAPVGVPGLTPERPPVGVVSRLPGDTGSLALTIDDGTSSEVVGAFAAFAADSGVRLTFFPNGCYRSWTDNAPALQRLVDSGQVAMGNHTWSHPDLTTLPDGLVVEQLRRNRAFLRKTFGVSDTPFFRPPYGAHDHRIDTIAADLGHPTVTLWNGTLGDSRLLSAAELLAGARQWFTAQRIVVGHANHRPITTVYGDLLALLGERGLQTVTLADVWAAPTRRR